ncbi:hypothetical protein [Micromonospora sp. NBC_01813]|uniref:hypothetical protein n=1 Tax=Micromonospora sp. NBC_01813 TaxID=2975988 RepID=UPI002DDC0554|nr:hypothetical protein [Micromonospora sp. NBC_01813]WSA08657.1 hypothetical protein OG958_31535 [Micromonospora sp. NBC_01813]
MGHRRALTLGAAAVAVVVVVAGAAGWWWHQRSPYGPEVLKATATLRLVDQARADAAFGGRLLEATGEGAQIFLGQVAWTPPPQAEPGAMLIIAVVDTRTRTLPGFIATTSNRPDQVGTGSDGVLNAVEERYPWLQGVGAREVHGGSYTSGSVVIVTSVDAAPVTYSFVLYPARPETSPEFAVASAPAAVDDLMVALISIGPDRQIYWAERLLN